MFIGRKNELDELERRYRQSGFQMPVIYGRRRVGKTRLINEFCKGKTYFFYVATEQAAVGALHDFSRALLDQLPSSESSYFSTFPGWKEAFLYLANQAKKQRLIAVIDEYPYLAKSDPSISSILQAMIDHEWKDSDLYLILCGSSMSFMENQVLGYQSPLYGRRTAQLKIRPLPYWYSIQFFPNWSWEEKLYAYGICGGVPQYLEYFAQYSGLEDAVVGEFLSLSGHLSEEPQNLMKQEMREPALYNEIIAAVATGANRQNEIAGKTGKDTKGITPYLKALLDLEVLEKVMPIGEKNRKKTQYRLADNLFRFWYYFLPESLPMISLGMSNIVWKERIEPKLDQYFSRIFESICLQYVMRGVRDEQITPLFSEYGSWWGTNQKRRREEEIDVVARSETDLLVGECKWRNGITTVDVLSTLEERAELIRGSRSVKYILFSRSGFSSSLEDLNREDVTLIRAEALVD